MPGITVDTISSGWEEIFEYLDDFEKACASELMKNHVPAPDIIGFELESQDNGAVIGEASMAWTDRRIALLMPKHAEYKETFEKENWKVILSTESLTLEKFGGEG